MRISETFLSIQGESSYMGLPTLFIRTYGCNMRCTWCDTKYAVEGGDFKEQGVGQIMDLIKDNSWVKHICFTGGEPLLWKNEVLYLINQFQRKVITIETDGGIWLGEVVSTHARLIMDVKCPGSRQVKLMNWENLNIIRPGTDEIKFVLTNEDDYKFAKTQIEKYKLLKRGFEVLMSAVHAEPSEWEKKPSHTEGLSMTRLADWILTDRLNVRLQPQLHKVIWPDKERAF